MYADTGELSLVFLDTNGGALIYDIISEDCIRGADGQVPKVLTEFSGGKPPSLERDSLHVFD